MDQAAIAALIQSFVAQGKRYIFLYNESTNHDEGTIGVGVLEYRGSGVITDTFPAGQAVHFGWDSLTGAKYIFGNTRICWPGDSSVPESYQKCEKAFAFCRFEDWGSNWYYLKYGQRYAYVPLDDKGLPCFAAIKPIAPQGEVTPCCWRKHDTDVTRITMCSACRRLLLRCEHCDQLTAMAAGEAYPTHHICEHCGELAIKPLMLEVSQKGAD